MIDFENYLEELFMSDYAGTDDDSPEAFDVWMEDLSQQDLIDFANKYAKICSNNEPH